MSATRPSTWRQLLAEATDILASADEARRVVEEASGLSPAELILALDDAVPARSGVRLSAMVERRAAGEPLQYALGRWGFRTLDLMVDRRVLIPRPETEVVAGLAIEEGRRLLGLANRRPPDDRDLLVADLGTGSGAIAFSVAAELPPARVWATDASGDALDVASSNLCGLGTAATRVHLARGSWFDALPASLRGGVGLVVSNPPYIADGEPLPTEVSAWEPSEALRSGPTGLECLSAIIAGVGDWLTEPGTLVLELAPHQASAVADMAVAAGFAADQVAVRHDLTGRERVLVARR